VFGTHDLALFAFTVLVLNATPGVDMMLTTTRTLQHGVRAGLVTAAGICAGCIVHTLAAAFGLAALLAASAAAFTVIKWAGAAYLAWLAIGMLRQAWAKPVAAAAAAAPPTAPTRSAGEWFRTGLLTNALNPKVALFFLALLPQFIDAAAPDKTLAFVFLGAWFIVQGYLFLALLVIMVAPLRRWRAPAAVQRGVWAVGGGLFVALAARLALAQRP
jgi:threonine/homoserine/homoserine lactone efflux protein